MVKTVKIDGMSCPCCVERVKSALTELGIEAEVSIGEVKADFKDFTDAKIKDEIESLGFDVVSIA